MSIDWNTFTPWSALASGVLIGLAAAMFALLNGIDWDIAGFCPGPGLVALGISETKAMAFRMSQLCQGKSCLVKHKDCNSCERC